MKKFKGAKLLALVLAAALTVTALPETTLLASQTGVEASVEQSGTPDGGGGRAVRG